MAVEGKYLVLSSWDSLKPVSVASGRTLDFLVDFKPGDDAHAFNSNIWEAEAGESLWL